MVRQVTATEAKAKLLSLLDDIAAGDEIEITRHGRRIARLVPAASPHALRGSVAAQSRGDDESLYSTGGVWEAS